MNANDAVRLITDPSVDRGEKVVCFQMLLEHDRSTGRSDAAKMFDSLMSEREQHVQSLRQARETQNELREVLEKLLQPALYPATVVETFTSKRGEERHLVASDRGRSVVAKSPDVEDRFVPGDCVLLSQDGNCIMERSTDHNRSGALALFDQDLGNGRLMLRNDKGDEIVVETSAALRSVKLHAGDRVRFDPKIPMALEILEKKNNDKLFLEETPTVDFTCVGGLEAQIAEIEWAVRMRLDHRKVVDKYKLRAARSILLTGAPGNGKTLLAKCTANLMGRLSKGGKSLFMNVKPMAMHSMWYGQSEQNYRDLFATARKAAERDDVPVVIFMDEIDAVARARGGSIHGVDDRVLTSLMAELDGLEDRGNIMILAATNRADSLDTAILRPGRMGDLVIDIPRPDEKATRDIFDKHLDRSIPYLGGNGASRLASIDRAVERVFSREATVAHVHFQDGAHKAVTMADLLSGAIIANAVRSASEKAARREIGGGEPGVSSKDLIVSIEDEFRAKAARLTPQNLHDNLTDVPREARVVSVRIVDVEEAPCG